MQFYNRALTADEVAQAYNNNPQGVSGLTAWYDFNEIASGTTGSFDNKATGSAHADTKAVFYNLTNATLSGDGGYTSINSYTETAPTMAEGRTIETKYTVTLPEGLTAIGRYAFGASLPCGIILPETLEYVGSGGLAFGGALYVPRGIEMAESGAFDGDTVYTSMTAEKAEECGMNAVDVIFVSGEECSVTLFSDGDVETRFVRAIGLPVPEKRGCKFVGWREEDGGFADMFYIPVKPEVTLTAVFADILPGSGRSAETPYAVRGKMPVIDDCVCWFSCKVIDKMETATHTVFLGEVLDADVLRKDAPMTYAYYHKVLKGRTAANAPTYQAEEKSAGKYVCKICKYEYDGETPFEELPDDWTCPICGAPKSQFEKK